MIKIIFFIFFVFISFYLLMSCIANTLKNKACTNKAKYGSFCGVHKKKNIGEMKVENKVENDYVLPIFLFSGKNDETWIKDIYVYPYTQYIHPIENIVCNCSGCGFDISDILNEFEQKQTNNYINKHCLDCKCRWCVCQARKINDEFESYPTVFHWDNTCRGSCIVCKEMYSNKNYDGLSNISIQRKGSDFYLTKLKETEIQLYISRKKKIGFILKDYIYIKPLRNIICEYIDINDINSNEVVNLTHKRGKEMLNN